MIKSEQVYDIKEGMIEKDNVIVCIFEEEKMRVGFTCSTFDLLHAGHVIMLREAKEKCDYSICGLQVDPSIDRKEKIPHKLL